MPSDITEGLTKQECELKLAATLKENPKADAFFDACRNELQLPTKDTTNVATTHTHPCPCCSGRMMIVELFEPGSQSQHQPITPKIRMDTS